MLGERRHQRGGTLSGGQQRLLSLAKVLVVPPKLLIADELSLGLSPAVVDAVYEQLRLINQQGTALLVVEQQVDRVLALARRRRPRARDRHVRRAGRRGARRRRAVAGRRDPAAVVRRSEMPDVPPLIADERAMLTAWLDFHRRTLLDKCDGL